MKKVLIVLLVLAVMLVAVLPASAASDNAQNQDPPEGCPGQTGVEHEPPGWSQVSDGQGGSGTGP
ncbi:MAG: hypothetical protein JXD18_11440 [Anaerolineae bacterium]|nr:hypothetical protein [Anaerolineae bacterium]